MKKSFRIARGILIPMAAVLLINSCVDPLYDLSKGVDTELKVGGDSLALPIGSTDSIKLGDFLNSDDLDFLETMADGGYGFTMSDSMVMDDLLKSLDKSKLKFADQVFNQNVKVSFGDIDISQFKIPGFTIKQSLDVNIPAVNLGNVTPAVNVNNNYTVDFAGYKMEDSKMIVPDKQMDTRVNDILANIPPLNTFTLPVNPSTDFVIGDPIDIGNVTVPITYSIEVPAGITNIHQIDLEAGGVLEITLELDTATQSLSTGIFTPAISIDPTNLFTFNPFTPLTDGKIVFGNSNSMTNLNQYRTTRTYTIDSFKNLPAALSGKIDISKMVAVSGNIDGLGTIMANKALDAKKIDMVVHVLVKNVKMKNLDFDIPTMTTSINGTSPFAINNTLPSQVAKINKIYFGKTAGSTLPTNLVIEMKPTNMPVMKSFDYKINSLNITFPSNFAFSNMSGQTYTATNVAFDPVNGYKIQLDLSEIDLSSVNVVAGVLNWSGNISYSGNITFNGRMESKNINSSQNPNIAMTSSSAIKLISATVVTNTINETIAPNDIIANLNIDVAVQVARLGVINVKPGGFIRVNINKPTLPLNLVANGISITFSNLFEFKPTVGLSNNTFTINGTIPEYIELELKALHINKDLVDGKLTLNEKISIAGGVTLQPGTVNSADIEALGTKKIEFEAKVSDMFIESTSIEMKTLEASMSNKTPLEMVINDIPSELVALDSILIKDGASLKLDIKINNMPSLGGKPLNANIKLKFPQMLKFTSGSVNSNNELVINEAFVNGALSKSVGLKGLGFDGSNLNGKLSIKDSVAFDVNVSVENPTINSADLNGQDISVDVKVTLAGLEFKSVYGKFNVDLGDQLNIPEVSLDDLPAILKGNDIVLDIAKPVISMSTESNIGIPVDAELSMTKIIGGVLQTNDKLSFNVGIPKAASAAQTVKSAYWVSPSDAGKPAGYTFIQRNVQDLFKPIPDAFKLELKPTINTAVQHLIDLSANYKMKVKYDIIIPFSFGKDLSIVLKDTIDNINLELPEMNLKTGSLEILGRINNSIPLVLNLELVMMDANNNILSTSPAQTILAGAPNGGGVISNITIKLADDIADLKQLKKIALVFRASSNTTVAGTPLRPSNFIQADLKLRLNGGINIKLDL